MLSDPFNMLCLVHALCPLQQTLRPFKMMSAPYPPNEALCNRHTHNAMCMAML